MNTSRLGPCFGMIAALLSGVSCQKKSEQTQSAPTPELLAPTAIGAGGSSAAEPAPSASSAAEPAEMPVPGPAAAAAGMSGTLSADPNPVPVCDKTGGDGVTTVSWTAKGTPMIQIRLNSPNGGLWLTGGGAAGKSKTQPWVAKGTTFYLQDVANNAPLTADHTLAKLTVDTVGGGKCPADSKIPH